MKNPSTRISLFPYSLIFLLPYFLFSLTSCKPNTPAEIPNLGYSYFPVNTGHYIIYDVDSNKRDCFSKIVSNGHYQIKEVIASEFIDNQGRPTLRIERYRKDSWLYPDWTIYNVWTANITSTTAERFENNIRYVKLVFPIENGKAWNGNSMNTDAEEDYEYLKIHEPLTFNSFVFDSVITVQQADDMDNFVTPKFKLEQYAAGVGLIYRKKLEMEIKTDSLGMRDSCYIDYAANNGSSIQITVLPSCAAAQDIRTTVLPSCTDAQDICTTVLSPCAAAQDVRTTVLVSLSVGNRIKSPDLPRSTTSFTIIYFQFNLLKIIS